MFQINKVNFEGLYKWISIFYYALSAFVIPYNISQGKAGWAAVLSLGLGFNLGVTWMNYEIKKIRKEIYGR